ncbi:hypothetical protein HMPREF3036_00213 [Sutterella sp. KLE1602]|nr:hypothetical protein HMPREF3036_00213 [Sutterella sp. KLE1602]
MLLHSFPVTSGETRSNTIYSMSHPAEPRAVVVPRRTGLMTIAKRIRNRTPPFGGSRATGGAREDAPKAPERLRAKDCQYMRRGRAECPSAQ